jgi:hypothetical protein
MRVLGAEMHSIWLYYWKEDTLGKTFKWRSKTLHYKYIYTLTLTSKVPKEMYK